MAQNTFQFTKDNLTTDRGIAELNRLLKNLAQSSAGDGETVRIYDGFGSPEGVVSAGIGSIYLRKDGTPSNTFYIKESGALGTGWRAV